MTAANEDWLVFQLGVITLCDGGIERVTIDMGDIKSFECRMGDQSPTVAFITVCRTQRGSMHAIAAKRVHIYGLRPITKSTAIGVWCKQRLTNWG